MSKNRETHRVDVGRTQTWCRELLAGRVITHGRGVDRVAERSIRWTTSGVYRCSACYRTRRDERRAEQSAASRPLVAMLAAAAAVALVLLCPGTALAASAAAPSTATWSAVVAGAVLPLAPLTAALGALVAGVLAPAVALAATSAAVTSTSGWWVAPAMLAVAGCLPRLEVSALLALLKSEPSDFERKVDAAATRTMERAAILEGVGQLADELLARSRTLEQVSLALSQRGSSAGSYDLINAGQKVHVIAWMACDVAKELSHRSSLGPAVLAQGATDIASLAGELEAVAEYLREAEGPLRAQAVELRTYGVGIARAGERLAGGAA